MRKSIKKTTVIIVLALFLTISVGYALFSDTITIEGTATAQGNFDIKVECLNTIPDNVVGALTVDQLSDYEYYKDNGFKSEQCIVDDENDSLTYQVSFEYPGASKWWGIKLSNKGTMAASFDMTKIIPNKFKYVLSRYDSLTNNLISSTEENKSSYGFFETGDIAVYVDKEGNLIDTVDSKFAENFADSSTLIMEPNEAIYLFSLAQWPSNGYTEEGVYYKAVQTLTFPFSQYNE